MDYFRIIKQKGYREEDLNENDQYALRWLKILRDDFENFDMSIYDDSYDEDDASVIAKLKQEIAADVTEYVAHWMGVQIAEYQIGMAESQPGE